MNPSQTPFLCLEHDEIREFLETDFSQSHQGVTRVLRIHDHELHVSRHPIQPPLFTVALLSRLTNAFSLITSIVGVEPISVGVGLQCRDSPLLPRAPMIEPLDRSRRDSTLFQFTTKQLRDLIDPNHLLSKSMSNWTSPGWCSSWKITILLTSADPPSILK